MQYGRVQSFLSSRTRELYLVPCENRASARGTDLQRHKIRITIILCVNGDGSHSVLCRYIGQSTVPNASVILVLNDAMTSTLTSGMVEWIVRSSRNGQIGGMLKY